MNGTASAFVPVMVSPTRSVLAHLLHALNQQLTGLQCSLELAVATSRTPEQYARTLREGLELTARMRLLVETIRELTDPQQVQSNTQELFPLDVLVSETIAGLRPVAEEKNVRLVLQCRGPLSVQGDRKRLIELTFRLLESVISLSESGTEVPITMSSEEQHCVVTVSWNAALALEHSPFSRAELGLLLARAGWEQMDAKWNDESAGKVQRCTIRIPLASSSSSLG
jgi:hypothetical protein